MLNDLRPTVSDVKDLAAHTACCPNSLERLAAVSADRRRVCSDLVRLCDLLERVN